MKNIFALLFTILFCSNTTFSQNNNLVIYSQEGIKFTIILNGVRQNMQPETNVKVTDLNAPSYQVKLIFANNMPDLNQTVYLMFGGELTKNTEYTYALATVKGKYKLKFKGTAPINGNAVSYNNQQQSVIIYNPTNTAVGTSTTNSTTTTTSTSGSPNGNVGVNINTNGVNVNVGGTSSNTTTTTSTTTTTTTTTVGTINSTPANTGNGTSAYVLPGYTGVYGCPQPMSVANFEAAKKSIEAKGFDESRLTIAKQIISTNCLLSSQIKELMLLMSFEQTKLDLAKYAWHHTLDRGNYYQLNDAFSFESSITELNRYIQSH